MVGEREALAKTASEQEVLTSPRSPLNLTLYGHDGFPSDRYGEETDDATRDDRCRFDWLRSV